MASKRKQDDKHLKLLREMVSREHNKTCFECNQRGPTYVDMTIGTFVCTSCSGILRGINPPHRVKSISMASYTPAEIEFLEKNGNEVCRHIWLGLCNSSSQPGPDSKEDNKVRDYLVQKYEKKRWYVEPSQAAILAAAAKSKKSAAADENSIDKKSTSSTHSTPEPRPLKSLIGSNAIPVKVSQPPGHSVSAQDVSKPPPLAQTANKQRSVDLLADLGADPFGSSSQASQMGGFGQAPFGQQAAFGQPAQQQQQTPFGQAAPQAAFGQPAQQGGFADFSQAFGGAPAQNSQAFPETTADDAITTSSSTGDLADLFFPPQSTEQPDPFLPASSQAAHPTASAASNNSFGAFESAFTPQVASAPVPTPAASSSATLNPTVQGLQGLSINNSTPPSGGSGSVGSSGGDKYAAFASLSGDSGTSSAGGAASSSINWSGGAGAASSSASGIDWGSGFGGGAAPTKTTAPSSSFDWGSGMAKPAAQPASTSLQGSSLFGTPPTSSAFGAGAVPTSQGNPFMGLPASGANPATSTMATNPFLGGGAPATNMGAPAQPNGMFGMQSVAQPMPAQNPMMMAGVGGGAFGQMPQQPGVGGGANMQMNGRVGAGYPQGQMGGAAAFGMQPAAMPNQFGMQGTMQAMPGQPQPVGAGGAMGFGGAGMAAMAGLQFNKMGQPQAGGAAFGQVGVPQQPTPQQQQFASWGAAPNAVPQANPMAANPFMAQGGGFNQAPVPPKSNVSNPFL